MTNKYISIPLHHDVYDMQAYVYSSGGTPISSGNDLVHIPDSNGTYYFDLSEDISSETYVSVRVYESGIYGSSGLLWEGSLVVGEDICRDTYPPLLNVDANLTNVNGNSLRVGTFANWLDNNRLDESISNLPTISDIRHQIEMLNGVRNWPVYNSTPLFEPSGIDNGTATWPNVVSISSTDNHIFYSALDESGRYCINHRTLSQDGRSVGTPTRIIVGDQSYDQGGLFLPVVEREGSTLHMFYCGMPSLFANQQICYATAHTGSPTVWTKQGVAIPYSGLPSYLHGGAEPTALLKNGSTYYLYFCSVKGTQSPGYGTYISQQDRRAAVATSTDLTNWTIYPIMCSTGVESAQQSFLYLISGNAFKASSSATALFYFVGAGGGTNTDYQQIELFESPSPLFPAGYTKHIGTILTTNESGGGFPTSEIDVIDIMSDDIEKDTYVNTSGEIRIYFGGKSYGESWKLGLITQPNISEALRPPIQTHNIRMTNHLSSFPSIEIDNVYNSINNLPSLLDSGVTVSAVNSGAVQDIFSTYTIDESYAATGVPGTPAQILYFMQQTFSQFDIDGVTITVKKLDGSTTAATFTMDSSGSPTSRVRAT